MINYRLKLVWSDDTVSIFNYILSNITKWNGTTSRGKYWQIFFIVFIFGFILEVISRQMTGISLIQQSFYFKYTSLLHFILLLLFTLLNLMLWVFQIRRLNDLDLTRWLVLVNLIPIAGPTIMTLLMLKKGKTL
ncbi:DUF805 domain-containing protein [Enterococcus faecium]|nr:DUF805 domain-containing protein [Enterococcus faecium]QKL18737.1 DUF805 domain-containing protein [Enterococcus faecium]